MPKPGTAAALLAICAGRPLPPGDLDTAELAGLAATHGVMPLVTRALGQNRERDARRALAFTAELLHVLNILGARRIPVLPLRGPVMADWLYGDPALREFSDLDILVRKEDLPRAIEALAASSYKLQSPLPIQQECSRRWGFEVSMQRQPQSSVVDLHWELGPRYYPFVPLTVWNDLETVSFEQKPVPFFSPESLLLTLCIHGAKHHWDRLKWLCDIARLVAKPGLDWDKIAANAALSHCRPPVLLGLWLAHDLLAAEVPSAFLDQARRSASVQALSRQIRNRLFSDNPGPYSAEESCKFHFKLAGFTGGLRFAGAVLLIPTDADWNWIHLPRGFRWLYYPLRLLRLILKRAGGAGI